MIQRRGFKNKLGLYVITIGFILGFSLCWIVPNIVSNLIKPVPVLLMMVQIADRKRVRLRSVQIIMLVWIAVIIMNCLVFPAYSSLDGIAYIINILYCLSICYFGCSKKNLKILLNGCKTAALVLAICIIISNPFWETIRSSDIRLLWGSVNKNSLPYLIASGIVIANVELIGAGNRKKKFICIVEIIIMLYGVLYPMSRGGFLTVFVGTMIVWIPVIQKNIKHVNVKGIAAALFALLLLLLVLYYMPQAYKDRLLSIRHYSFHNSGDRDRLWSDAVALTGSHFIFGKGFGYYQNTLGVSYGAHNCFVDIYVAMGIVGLLLFVSVFLYIAINSKKNNCILALLAVAFLTAFLESQNTYQIWVPLALCLIQIKVRKTIIKNVLERV